MSTMKSTWRRIACSVILALFTASVIGGTVCTGHIAPHASHAHGWMSLPSHSSEAQHSHAEPDRIAASARQDGAAGAITNTSTEQAGDPSSDDDDCDAGCNPPVYVTATTAADGTKQIDPGSSVQLDVVPVQWVLEVRAAAPDERWLHAPPAAAAPPPQNLFSVSARLRI
ncbi:hypothetical protein [Roseateles saccharophilus]|uniref:hypothetical protein n=2 Tax=Roseateles saccharophilus TaxID=304 RepID=UPI001042E0A2|nr:hypothetical protein [Roseateles saccharophilus]MDG0833162.1 hypothetical protein [Roseateles saccharophilus]